MTVWGNAVRPVSSEEHYRISRFLFEEAALLDDRQYYAWLELFSPDIEYRIPSRIHRQQIGLKDDWAVAKELGQEDELPLTQHNRASLKAGIDRIASGRSVSDNPPWFTERVITNIVADHGCHDDERLVQSKFVVQRYRMDREHFIFGHRQDVISAERGIFKIKKRTVILSSTSFRWSYFLYI